MATDGSTARRLLRLTRPLTLAWTAAFLLGLIVLATTAIRLDGELRQSDLDGDLELHAMATYGLTWIDDDGVFHSELYEREPEWQATYDIWIVRPPSEILLSPETTRFEIDDLFQRSQDLVDDPEPIFVDGVDRQGRKYRLHAAATFAEESDEAVAMIAVVGDPDADHEDRRRFVISIVGMTALLALAGLATGAALARWSLRPAFESLRQRESFVAAAAHELRNPLAALRGLCDGALHGDEESDAALRRMTKLLESTGRTVDDLLLFTRLDAGTIVPAREDVRLDLLIEAVLPEDDSVRLDAEEQVASIDPGLISVAIRNLVENARLHGGSTAVRVALSDQSIIVDDDGPGFPDEILARDEHSVSVVPSRRGSGLGLAIVSRIAALHGGELRLVNRSEGGARAVLRWEAERSISQ